MASVILQHRGLFLEWSTVMSAPVSPAMTRPAFEARWREHRGAESLEILSSLLSRAARTGTSSLDETPDEDVEGNELGPHGRALSFAEICEVWFRIPHGDDVAHDGPHGLMRQDAARVIDPDAWSCRDGGDDAPAVRKRIAGSLLKADAVVALGLPALVAEARAAEVLAWRAEMSGLAAFVGMHDLARTDASPAEMARAIREAFERVALALPPAPEHLRALADNLFAWSQNSPDPDWFRGDCLSAVLDDCGRAAMALGRVPEAGEASHWRRQALEAAARIAEEDGAAATAARLRSLSAQ